MKQIFTIIASLLFLSASAQKTSFNYEIKSIIQDGNSGAQRRLYAIVIVTGDRGSKMIMFDGDKDVGAGNLMLISKFELKATESQADDYRIRFLWN